MIQLRNKTEKLLLSITKNCETHFYNTHTKPQEALEIKHNKSRETFSFNSPTQIKGNGIIGLASLEV